MKFIADENLEKPVVEWLRGQGLDVRYIGEEAPATSDEAIVSIAKEEDRILVTNDKDFGELVFRQGKILSGIILIRATDERASNKIKLVKHVLMKLPSATPMEATRVLRKG
ncbi:MAG: hypothetical protein COX49_03620 [bacterium (Candidatus Stahlbacteria) CG23_combo_of_CG06-09_8_20_14_all_40_9]|nr:MAG: hypothetical protein COX49_03620 [bacterium (Candidatus Stahlbacteria) CG23_combo_of_CG06-09_8_20_14_all_40_9]